MFRVSSVEMGGRNSDSSMFLHLTDPGLSICIAYRFWLVQSDKRSILIDCGPSTEEALKRGFPAMNDPIEMLKDFGVSPLDVEMIILTHLHWDHADNISLFPNAKLVVQRSEVEFYRSSLRKFDFIDRHFSSRNLDLRIDEPSTLLIDGDYEVECGLKLLHVGGHTPGLQMALIETNEGSVLVASDAVPLNRNYIGRIPPGIATDLPKAMQGIERAYEANPDWLMTGHDREAKLHSSTAVPQPCNMTKRSPFR